MTHSIKTRQSTIQVKFAVRRDKTVLIDRFHSSPLKITKTFHLDDTGELFVYMMDVSPGMLDGDSYSIHMSMESESEVYLTNQAFTKIHPTPLSNAKLMQTFEIGQNALLEFFPE